MQRIRRRTLFDLCLGAVAVLALASAVPDAERERETAAAGRAASVDLYVWLPATIYARPDPASDAIRSLPSLAVVTVAWDRQVVARGGRLWVRVLAPVEGWLPGSAVSLTGSGPRAAAGRPPART